MSQLLSDAIVEYVESKPFVKLTELIPEMAPYWAEEGIDIVAFVNKMVEQGIIKQIEYVDTKNMPNRIRVRLYPARCTINSQVKK